MFKKIITVAAKATLSVLVVAGGILLADEIKSRMDQ